MRPILNAAEAQAEQDAGITAPSTLGESTAPIQHTEHGTPDRYGFAETVVLGRGGVGCMYYRVEGTHHKLGERGPGAILRAE